MSTYVKILVFFFSVFFKVNLNDVCGGCGHLSVSPQQNKTKQNKII
tara:strand:+ start:529 stop:666 length:138 start_codon:yes stop_codon:yes gene_type:complete